MYLDVSQVYTVTCVSKLPILILQDWQAYEYVVLCNLDVVTDQDDRTFGQTVNRLFE